MKYSVHGKANRRLHGVVSSPVLVFKGKENNISVLEFWLDEDKNLYRLSGFNTEMSWQRV